MINLTPVAMVIDRLTVARNPAEMARRLSDFGGAWPAMYELWHQTRMPYLILLAHTTERLRQGAPLTMMPKDDDELRKTLQHICADLAGQRCKWLLLLDQESTGSQIVQTELLLDFAPEGRS